MPDIFISPHNIKTTNNNLDNNNQDSNINSNTNVTNNNPDSQSHTAIKAINKIPGMLSALTDHPQKITFSQQDKDEEIILFMRRHFITNLPWIIPVIIALFAPLLIISLSNLLDFSLFPVSMSYSIILIFFYYLLVLGFALFNFIDWFYNIGIVSDKRLFDLDFERLSHIDLALTLLPEVEDVVYRQQGFFASVFNYGDVVAHTVTGKEDFIFEKVPKPDQVVELIGRYISDTGHGH
jgi:hypothetical protein